MPTHVRQLRGQDSATLVRGTDSFRTFAHEPRPARDLDPNALAVHAAVTGRNAQILYAGTGVQSFDPQKGS
jgi:hypothetical protein